MFPFLLKSFVVYINTVECSASQNSSLIAFKNVFSCILNFSTLVAKYSQYITEKNLVVYRKTIASGSHFSLFIVFPQDSPRR